MDLYHVRGTFECSINASRTDESLPVKRRLDEEFLDERQPPEGFRLHVDERKLMARQTNAIRGKVYFATQNLALGAITGRRLQQARFAPAIREKGTKHFPEGLPAAVAGSLRLGYLPSSKRFRNLRNDELTNRKQAI